MLTQNIFPRDFVGNSTWFQNCLAAEGQEFIEIKYGVAIMVEDNTFIGVFLPYFPAELPDTSIFACVFKLFLPNHPVAKGPGQRHGQNGEPGMDKKTGLAVFRRSFDEPSLF